MMMNESMINQQFLIEKIDTNEEEVHVLKTIGISEGKTVTILGKGYLEGSLLVVSNNVLLQLNPYFIKKIEGFLVKDKRK